MLLTARSAGDVLIVDLSGRLTLGQPAAAFREAIRRELDAGRRKFVVNLADCEFVDSAGLGELATALVRIHNAGGQLRLLKVTKRVHDLLRIAKLQPVFERHEDEAAALESMR
jgi:anti-sigma B factor antagonist